MNIQDKISERDRRNQYRREVDKKYIGMTFLGRFYSQIIVWTIALSVSVMFFQSIFWMRTRMDEIRDQNKLIMKFLNIPSYLQESPTEKE